MIHLELLSAFLTFKSKIFVTPSKLKIFDETTSFTPSIKETSLIASYKPEPFGKFFCMRMYPACRNKGNIVADNKISKEKINKFWSKPKWKGMTKDQIVPPYIRIS